MDAVIQPSKEGVTADSLTKATWLCVLGVVYGDIGTSPIYTLSTCLKVFPSAGQHEILGILSIIIWLLLFVVSLKYVMFITRADNRGEGGIFALLSLIKEKPWHIGFTTKLLLLGAALLYGDGILTPAISVLSAVEGVKTIGPSLDWLIVPLSLLILILLFAVQSKGSQRIGKGFGPVVFVGFLCLALLGMRAIYQAPSVLQACNPYWAFWLISHHPWQVVPVLGGAILAITGAEALYADMGHFGRKPTAYVWHTLVLPALALNYLGQGALVMSHMGDTQIMAAPFFSLVSPGIPAACLTILSAAATIIASQAMITGLFSITRQAIQLGFFPRLKIVHTNANVEGQIYIPFINTALALGVIAVVLIFRSSDALAHAYGTAVTGTMAISSFGFYMYCQSHWRMQVGRWPLFALVVSLFLCLDLLFFGANLLKFFQGGYLPLLIGAFLYTLMYTWRSGRLLAAQQFFRSASSLDCFLKNMDPNLPRVPGVAVFMSASSDVVPTVLLYHLRYNKIYYESTVLMTIITDTSPRATVEPFLEKLGPGIYRLVAHVGYMENVDVPSLLQRALVGSQLSWDISKVLYYFNHDLAFASTSKDLWMWQKGLFSFLLRCSTPAYYYFRVPYSQIIEMGIPVEV
jgi:KUP system potassium uptake protein